MVFGSIGFCYSTRDCFCTSYCFCSSLLVLLCCISVFPVPLFYSIYANIFLGVFFYLCFSACAYVDSSILLNGYCKCLIYEIPSYAFGCSLLGVVKLTISTGLGLLCRSSIN